MQKKDLHNFMLCLPCISIYSNKETPTWCTIYLQYISSSTSTCFGRIYSSSSGGTPYGYNNKYQLLYPYGVPPDDGLQIRPKHEVFDEIHCRLIVHQVGVSLNERFTPSFAPMGYNNQISCVFFIRCCCLLSWPLLQRRPTSTLQDWTRRSAPTTLTVTMYCSPCTATPDMLCHTLSPPIIIPPVWTPQRAPTTHIVATTCPWPLFLGTTRGNCPLAWAPPPAPTIPTVTSQI